MSFRISFRPGLAAMAVWLGCGLAGSLRAGEAPVAPGGVSAEASPAPAASKPTADPLELSRPGIAELQNRFPHKPDTLETLFGARRPAPLPMRVIGPSAHSKGLLDQESDWAFITPDDVINDYMMKQILKMPQYGPDGRDLSKLTPVQRYYERMSHGGVATPATGLDVLSIFGIQKTAVRSGETADSEPITVFGQRPSPLADFSSPIYDTSPARPDALSDLLSSARKEDLPGALRDRKVQEDQMEALKKIWGFQQPAPGPGLSQPGFSPGVSSVGSVDSLPAAGLRDPFVTAPLSQYSPPLAPAAPQIPAYPKAPLPPGLLDPSAPPPSLNPAKTAPPVFSVPQRRF